jgi:uncharacterized protein (DUF2236 family)
MTRNDATFSDEEAAALVPGPGSMIWRRGGDPRALGAAGYALLLQIAHPTVAAGVSQFSDYRNDPLGRLLRSVDYLMLMAFGGPDAAVKTARTLREKHKRIRGRTADGRRYHALEPGAWAWVHATLGDAAIAGIEHFAGPMTDAERAQFYAEWRTMGRLLGVADRDLPSDWNGYREYFGRVVAEHLEDSETVQDFLDYLRRDVRPPLRLLAGPVWRLAWAPAGHVSWVAAVGLLPPELRDRFGVRWTRRCEHEFQALGAVSRAAGPLIPVVNLVYSPERILRWRRDAIERQYLARPTEEGGGGPAADRGG